MGISFEELNRWLDIEFFLERESIPFRRSRGVNGEQLNVKTCPACGDDRWRLYFGTESGAGNCFVCGEGFNKFKLLKMTLMTDSRGVMNAAREILAEQGWRPKRTSIVAVDPGAVQLPVSDPLPLPDGSNLAYLENRGFDASIARYFHLRWCQYGWWKTLDDKGEVLMQDFSGRVIIPVHDLDGTLRTFQGRDVMGSSDRKYLFPKSLPGTGKFLFNGFNVIGTDHVVVAEGAFDVAAIKVAFDEDVELRHIVPIGTFGKHLSYGSLEGDDQLGRFNSLRQRGVKTVTIMWDGERNALRAALDAGKLLSGIGLQVRIALLPQDKDPNEIPADQLRQCFHSATLWSPATDVRLRLRNPYA